MSDMTMIEVEVVASGKRVSLPLSAAERLARLGIVLLPEPRPDPRYAKPAALPISSTWVAGRFNPGINPIH